ncbi:MAG: protein kinase [Burkholderiales bacterium]
MIARNGRSMDRFALTVGTRMGEVEIVRVLASGGFGIVYLARDHALDRDVAVKEFMPTALVARTDGQRVSVRSAAHAQTFALGVQSFVNEARLLARFSHPAMMKVYRFWKANGTAYMAMPFVRGPTLRDVRRSMSEPPTEAWLLALLGPLLDALSMLHAEGIYHRDIAPDNVLLSSDGMPILLDFGAARRLVGDRTQSITSVLKPRFAPIEQYAESTQLRQGPWTDVYALAAVVAYLLDGTPPPAATARSIHDDMVPLAERHIHGVSTGFLSALDWALAVRPEDRPQSAAAFRDALFGRPAVAPAVTRRPTARVARAPRPSIASTAFSVTEPWPPRAPAPRRRAWRVFAPTAAVLAVALIGWPLASDMPGGSPRMSAAQVRLVAVAPVAADSPVPAPTVRNERRDHAGSADPLHETPAIVPAPKPRPTTNVASARAPVAKHRGSLPAAVASRAPTTAKRVARIDPTELCASRNFFLRSYCVQKYCDEPRFTAHPSCVQARQQARNEHD